MHMSDEKRWLGRGATGCSVVALALAAAIALPGATASAQTAAPTGPVYYKGKGPGGNNSYAWRYEEDFSYLRDPGKSSDFFDPVKFIAFDDAKQVYVTFSALERLRYDNVQNNTFNLGSQLNAHSAEDFSRRTQIGADLHLGPNFRVYAELLNAASSGRDLNGVSRVGGTGGGTNWRNDLALQQAFIEAMTEVNLLGTPGKIGIRAGRQGLYLGNGLAVSFPSTSNIITIPDGIRAYADTGHDRLDVFFGVPTIRRNDDLLRDGDNQHEQFLFVYGSHDFPAFNLLGSEAHVSTDPFVIHVRNASGGTTNPLISTGATFRTITSLYGTGPAGTASAINGQDERYTIGDRLYGDVGNFDFDWTAQLQRGSFGGYSVEAFAIYTDWGYTLRGAPWRPRFGTHADVASGGGDKASKTTNLFDNEFLRQPYIGQVVNTAPSLTNLWDVAPRVRVQPTSTISAEFSWTFWWRYSSNDAIYGPAWINNGASSFAATLGKQGMYVGSQPQLDIRWTPIAHVAFDAEIGQMVAGELIKNAGGSSQTYGFVQATLQF
jgi:hypothetical protein